MQNILSYNEIRKTCDPAAFSGQLENGQFFNEIIGQERAIKALRLGLGIRAEGFNIYVSGMAGTGKLSLVKNFIEEQAKKEHAPPDWCYVNDFKDSYTPRKLSLPAGTATGFKKDMKVLIDEIYQSLLKVFDSEEYANRKGSLVNAFDEQRKKVEDRISDLAEAGSFMIKQTPMGLVSIPLKDKTPITDEEFNKLSKPEIKAINEKQDKLKEEINAGLIEIRKFEKATVEAMDKLAKEVASYAAGNLITELEEKYKGIPEVYSYLQSLKTDILDNLSEFLQSSKDSNAAAQATGDNNFLKRYEVTILVDNGLQEGAPVIIERNPTYNNLVGRVEKESYMGSLITNFTMIRKGSLHSANGGYLVIRIEEILANPFSWECLKRALKNKEIVIEEAMDQLGYFTTRTLKPEPVPLNVKVILIGSSILYQLLYQYDTDFRELFKVKADFDSSMDRTDENTKNYVRFIQSVSKKEHLPTPDSSAIAKVVEFGARLADDQDKLSTQFGKISDILCEAGYYSKEEDAKGISGLHVTRAIEQKMYRSNLIQEKLNEMITNKQIFIDISGEKIGQINGLSVLGLGDVSFGIPSRITCSVSLGKEGIMAIEREAELSGPIHTKGVLVLTGYLSAKFMQDKPLSLAARLVFEQSYSEVDGDSASSTEVYAILSALSSLPIKQGIAVTGSVNQKGEIQPIGGVNEKIEGYFEVCKKLGLNGEQGVMIPASNVRNLMLKEEVCEAIKEEKFKIWTVDTIDDGIELLTGVKAGSIWEDGTVFAFVHSTLSLYADKMRAYAGPGNTEGITEA